MSEQLISKREEEIQSTIDTMQTARENRTPEEEAAMLDAGLDMMLEDHEKNREFYARMEGLAALRNTVQNKRSDDLNEKARQRYGALGYDSSPRKIRKM